ncbi:hypothetical protein WG66_003033 [Moniliophthora roreri]|nr:hypothetical protein WG66_003033 [Moniliophthora roreri]
MWYNGRLPKANTIQARHMYQRPFVYGYSCAVEIGDSTLQTIATSSSPSDLQRGTRLHICVIEGFRPRIYAVYVMNTVHVTCSRLPELSNFALSAADARGSLLPTPHNPSFRYPHAVHGCIVLQHSSAIKLMLTSEDTVAL